MLASIPEITRKIGSIETELVSAKAKQTRLNSSINIRETTLARLKADLALAKSGSVPVAAPICRR